LRLSDPRIGGWSLSLTIGGFDLVLGDMESSLVLVPLMAKTGSIFCLGFRVWGVEQAGLKQDREWRERVSLPLSENRRYICNGKVIRLVITTRFVSTLILKLILRVFICLVFF
jgi:hypothetical protein